MLSRLEQVDLDVVVNALLEHGPQTLQAVPTASRTSIDPRAQPTDGRQSLTTDGDPRPAPRRSIARDSGVSVLELSDGKVATVGAASTTGARP